MFKLISSCHHKNRNPVDNSYTRLLYLADEFRAPAGTRSQRGRGARPIANGEMPLPQPTLSEPLQTTQSREDKAHQYLLFKAIVNLTETTFQWSDPSRNNRGIDPAMVKKLVAAFGSEGIPVKGSRHRMSEGVTRADCGLWCTENRHGPDAVPFQPAFIWPDGVSSLSHRSRGTAQIRTDSLLSC